MVAFLVSGVNVVQARVRGWLEISTLGEVGKFAMMSKLWIFVANICKVKEPGFKKVKT